MNKPHHCLCGETRPEMFKGVCKSTCYSCQKAASKRRYAENKPRNRCCGVCGETQEAKFYPNYAKRCKNCLYQRKVKIQREAKRAHFPSLPMFTCRNCGKIGIEHFYKTAKKVSLCKECYNQKATKYYYPFYDELVKTQGGEFCGICQRTPGQLGSWRLGVDHDHTTGLVRGLLCSSCNRNMGMFTAETALRMAKYLYSPPALHLQIQFPEKMKK